MNCNRARRLIFREIDDALTADEIQRLREHLAACPPCRRWREETRAQSALLSRTLTMESPSGDIETAVLRRIAELKSPDAEEGEPLTVFIRNVWLSSRRRWTSWAAVGMCFVALSSFTFHMDVSPEDAPVPPSPPSLTTGMGLMTTPTPLRFSESDLRRVATMLGLSVDEVKQRFQRSSQWSLNRIPKFSDFKKVGGDKQ